MNNNLNDLQKKYERAYRLAEEKSSYGYHIINQLFDLRDPEYAKAAKMIDDERQAAIDKAWADFENAINSK